MHYNVYIVQKKTTIATVKIEKQQHFNQKIICTDFFYKYNILLHNKSQSQGAAVLDLKMEVPILESSGIWLNLSPAYLFRNKKYHKRKHSYCRLFTLYK